MAPISEQLRLLADDTRLRILHLLAEEPLTVAELQDLLELSQSSVSGHLAKLKRAGFIHDLAEGSSHRYRLRSDMPEACARAWKAIGDVTRDEATIDNDRERLGQLRSQRGKTWVERVAGSLHREYAPGRTWESIFHAMLPFTELGRCADVGAGDGSMIDVLAPRCSELICVDPSPAMVTAGEGRIAELGFKNVRYLTESGEDLSLPEASCDSVLFLQSLQYMGDPEQAIRSAVRALAPGGRLSIVTLARHSFVEAERYGHRHRGFTAEQIGAWTTELSNPRHYALPPEGRAPRFQTLVFTGAKPK